MISMGFKIIVDADSCPVKQEILAVAKVFESEVVMVASFDHYLQPYEGVKTIQVDRSDQSVDLYIANHISVHNILVTQDFGLATIGLAKKATVLSNRGQIYNDRTIDFLLESRHEQSKKRRGGKYSKGPRPFTQGDRNKFQQTLTNILKNMQENSLT